MPDASVLGALALRLLEFVVWFCSWVAIAQSAYVPGWLGSPDCASTPVSVALSLRVQLA
jgi:hypothetical protein